MLVSEYTANPFSLVSTSFLIVSAVYRVLGCFSISLAKERCVYFAFLLECSHKDHFFLYLHCPKTHPFTTFIHYLSSPSKAHFSLFLPKLLLSTTQRWIFSLSGLEYCAPSPPNQTPDGIDAFSWSCLLPGKTLCKHLWTFSLSPLNLPSQNTTQKHWLEDELSVQGHGDQHSCSSAGQLHTCIHLWLQTPLKRIASGTRRSAQRKQYKRTHTHT